MMNIDAEMKLWEERSNDEFGKLLKSIIEHTNDYFISELGEDGFDTTPIEHYSAMYALDGEKYRLDIAISVYNILYNYDILDNDWVVKKLVNKLMKVAKS